MQYEGAKFDFGLILYSSNMQCTHEPPRTVKQKTVQYSVLYGVPSPNID